MRPTRRSALLAAPKEHAHRRIWRRRQQQRPYCGPTSFRPLSLLALTIATITESGTPEAFTFSLQPLDIPFASACLIYVFPVKSSSAVKGSVRPHRTSSTAITHSPPASAHLIELPSVILCQNLGRISGRSSNSFRNPS